MTSEDMLADRQESRKSSGQTESQVTDRAGLFLFRDYGECGLRYHRKAAGVKAKGFHAPAASTWAKTKGPWGSRNPGPFLAFVGLFS